MFYLRIAFAVIVMVVWAVVVLGSYLRHESPPGIEGLSAIMLATVTGVFSSAIKQTVKKRITRILEESETDAQDR